MAEGYEHMMGSPQDTATHPDTKLPEPGHLPMPKEERGPNDNEKYPWNKSFPDKPKPAMPEFGENRD